MPYLSFPLVLAVVLMVGGCAHRPDDRNYEACLKGERTCDFAALSATQCQLIDQRVSQGHLQDCMERRRCNESLLTERELTDVRVSVARLNLTACERGEVDCDERLLTEPELTTVLALRRERNLDHCLSGLTECDESALSEAEKAAVHEAYLARNFHGCMNSVGTVLECNRDDLNDSQREQVRQRNVLVNEYLCRTNGFGCDPSQLTAEQRASWRPRGALQ